jgi:hypothetical protein
MKSALIQATRDKCIIVHDMNHRVRTTTSSIEKRKSLTASTQYNTVGIDPVCLSTYHVICTGTVTWHETLITWLAKIQNVTPVPRVVMRASRASHVRVTVPRTWLPARLSRESSYGWLHGVGGEEGVTEGDAEHEHTERATPRARRLLPRVLRRPATHRKIKRFISDSTHYMLYMHSHVTCGRQ